jgi:hypothetical protein
MTLPYQNATVGDRAIADIQKILRAFGCTKFGTFSDDEEASITVQFEYKKRPVQMKASIRGYAAAWLKEHPYNASRMKATRVEHERKALNIASVAVYSMIRDWIKGQITAIETGMLTFEGAFLAQLLLPDGKTVMEEIDKQALLAPSASRNALTWHQHCSNKNRLKSR